MAPGATSILSIICPWLYGDSHLIEQKQEQGQDSTRRTIYFAQKFIEILLSANAGYTVETQKETQNNANNLVIVRTVHKTTKPPGRGEKRGNYSKIGWKG